MKRIVLAITLLFLGPALSAQHIPAEVRAVMDANKVKGIDIWTGIITKYTLTAHGLDSARTATLIQRASQHQKVKSIRVMPGGAVQLACAGGTPFDKVKMIFSSLVNGIENVNDQYLLETTLSSDSHE